MNFFSYLIFLSILTYISAYQLSSYAPFQVSCPHDQNYTRTAASLSNDEKNWLQGRKKITNEKLISFLKYANLVDFNPSEFINNSSIGNIGLAFSGGGYRAMLAGAGMLAALDERVDNANVNGLGGLLQASSHIIGLLGGNWLTGTVFMNNFTSVQDILSSDLLWQLENSILNPGGLDLVDTIQYYQNIIKDDIDAKERAGFEVTITDTWGRALSDQFLTDTKDNGASARWSDIANNQLFETFQTPFPISIANARYPNNIIINSNSTIVELNPFEVGSWDPSLYQFTPTKYLGTKLYNGAANGSCIRGFDNAGFIIGTSSSLFNSILTTINTEYIPAAASGIAKCVLQDIAKTDEDIAAYKPNPFYHTKTGYSADLSNHESLALVDGGEDKENVPFYPLLQPERNMDVIFGFDVSSDTDQHWPDGTALVSPYERQFSDQGNGTVFPYVPDQRTILNLNFTAKPAFFGCNAKNLTSLGGGTNTPLIVYTANRPFTAWSNTSTFKLSYQEWEKRGMIQNGYGTATRLNGTLDKDWPACVGCAIIRREQERQGLEQSDQCKKCFEKYCWDGTIDDHEVPGVNFTDEGITSGNNESGNRTLTKFRDNLL